MKDPGSTFWTEAGDLQGLRTEIPMAMKRKAVDLYSQRDRFGEEITLLKGDMNITVHHFSQQHQLLRASLQSDSHLENEKLNVSFAPLLHLNCTALIQSESCNFSVYIINTSQP